MKTPPDWVSLRIFLTALEVGSIFKASEKLGIANSAAAKRLQTLEAEAGVQLLEKGVKGVVATAAGEAYARRARALLDFVGQLGADMREFAQGGVGTVRLLASPSAFAGHDLTDALASFGTQYPSVLIDARERTSLAILQELADGKADLGLITGAARIPENLEAAFWREDRLIGVFPADHPLAKRKRVSFNEMLNYPMVETLEFSAVSMLLLEIAQKLGRRIDYRYRVSSMDAARRVVASGIAIGVMPDGLVKPYCDLMNLRPVALDEPWAARRLRLVSQPISRLPAAARILRDHLLGPAPAIPLGRAHK